MKIFLRGINERLVEEWHRWFDGEEDVNVSLGDIFAPGDHMNVEAIVSPANSFGFMDGGIDYVYSDFFGWKMSEILRQKIWVNHGGELPVGQAELVNIKSINPNSPINYLISAPTMRVPMEVGNTVNAYLAFRAAIRIADANGIKSILCPGLATAVGGMLPQVCAIQMYEAYKHALSPRVFDVLGIAHANHHAMLSPQVYSMRHQAHG